MIPSWSDRRKHRRMTFIEPMRHEAELKPEPPFIHPPIRGVIAGLSAGGIEIQLPDAVPRNAKCRLSFELPILGRISVHGKVRRLAGRAGLYRIGFAFENLEGPIGQKINDMAVDWNECELRIARGPSDVCIGQDCRFYALCDKPQKIHDTV